MTFSVRQPKGRFVVRKQTKGLTVIVGKSGSYQTTVEGPQGEKGEQGLPGPIGEKWRKTICASPDHINVQSYGGITQPDGSIVLHTVRFRDGREWDLTAPGRGLPKDYKHTRNCIYPSPDYDREIRTIYLGPDQKIQRLDFTDNSIDYPAGVGVRSAKLKPDMSVAVATNFVAGSLTATGETGIQRQLLPSGCQGAYHIATSKGQYKIVTDRPSLGDTSAFLVDLYQFTTSPNKIVSINAQGKVLYHSIVIIQSQGIGSNATDIPDGFLKTVDPNMLFLTNSESDFDDVRTGRFRGNPSSAQRIVESDINGFVEAKGSTGLGNIHGLTQIEVANYQWVREARETFDDTSIQLVSAPGIGSTGFRTWFRDPEYPTYWIKPDTAPGDVGDEWKARSEFDAVVAGAKRLATGKGWGYFVQEIQLAPSLADENNTGATDDMRQVIQEIVTDLQSENHEAYTGQTGAPLIWGFIPNNFDAADLWHTSRAMLAIQAESDAGTLCAGDTPITFRIFGPEYAVLAVDGFGWTSSPGTADGVHMKANGSIYLGELAWHYRSLELLGVNRKPLQWIDADVVRVGQTITVPYEGGKDGADNPLSFDTAAISEQAGTVKGFRYMSGGLNIIQSVSVLGRTITITLTADAAGELGYADFGYVTTSNTDRFEAEQARGNLRVTNGYEGRHDPTWTIYDWAIPQRKEL